MLLLLLACTSPDEATPLPDRADGDRTPIAVDCDPLDTRRCWLPWPSSAATVLADTPTGVRVAVAEDELPLEDDPRWLELADGFSRVSPVLTALPGKVAADAASVRLFVAWDGAPQAIEVPAWAEAFHDGETTLLLGYPSAVLPANADIVVVVPGSLRLEDGTTPVNDHLDRVALGVDDPDSADEDAVRAWYAPVRRTLADAGIDPATVYRAWSFTTRSAEDPALRLRSMLADVKAASLGVTVDEVEVGSGSIAMIVHGTVDGVPQYRPDDEGWLNLGDDGLPVAVATHSAPFRIVVPAGEGDYPVALYGHGTGGDVNDASFDADIAARGIAKAGMQYWGWNGEELLDEVTYLKHVFDGSTISTSALLQSLADGQSILTAMNTGVLADVLAGETIGGVANPAAGRRPLAERPIWVGGSLGGTTGAVMVAASDDIDTGIVNVPAGAWSHLIPRASLYTLLAQPITHAWYPTDLDARAAIAMSQNAWDDMDGAAWEDPGSTLLIQESIGDPVVPNVGTAMLARARGAALVGAPLDDMLLTLEQTDGVTGRTGVTQFLTPYTDDYDIHGFAALGGPAGDAAREQIEAFLLAWRDGQPPPVIVPSGCEGGVCDFSE